MPSQPVRAVVEHSNPCPLARLLGSAPGVTAYIRSIHEQDGVVRAWVQLRGRKEGIRLVLRKVKREKGTTHTQVNVGSNTSVVQVSLPHALCPHSEGACLLKRPGERIHVVSAQVREGRLYLLVVAPSLKALEGLAQRGYRVVRVLRDPEPVVLTEEQERVLAKAYLMGYYEYPRRANLKDLARELGVSVSTVAETLRRIERKMVERFVWEEPFILLSISGEGPGEGSLRGRGRRGRRS